MTGKCPKCDGGVDRAIVNVIDLDVIGGQTFRGLTYSCPHCRAVLGVQMNPDALEADILQGVADLLRKQR